MFPKHHGVWTSIGLESKFPLSLKLIPGFLHFLLDQGVVGGPPI